MLTLQWSAARLMQLMGLSLVFWPWPIAIIALAI